MSRASISFLLSSSRLDSDDKDIFLCDQRDEKNDRIDDEEEKPRSAREVLFGDRNGAPVPNIFDRSSDERNDWRKQYASKPLQYH